MSVYAEYCAALGTHDLPTFTFCLQHSKRMSPAERKRLQAHTDAKKMALAALDHLEDSEPRSLSNLAWSQATLPLGPPHFLPKVRGVSEAAQCEIIALADWENCCD